MRPFLVRIQSHLVEWFIAFVIFANTVVLGVQLEVDAQAKTWLFVDAAFAAVFGQLGPGEVEVRRGEARKKRV